MSVIAEFRFRSGDLILGETFDAAGAVRADLVSVVASDPTDPVLFCWVRAPDFSAFEAGVLEEPTVQHLECYEERDSRRFYRIEGSSDRDVVFYPVWVESGAALVEGRYADGWWVLRMRFPDADGLQSIFDWSRENDIDFECERVYHGRSPEESISRVLTPEQREALRLGLAEGYFDVPRDATLAELAERLGVSPQALSERIRRGQRRLLDAHLDAGQSVDGEA